MAPVRRTMLAAGLATGLAGTSLLGAATVASGVGPETLQERGRTVKIVDGDTVLVDVWGDGTRTPKSVRFTGVNANEIGQCHAAAATARTRGLALGHRTRLLGIDPASMSRMRLLRTVLVRRPDGSFKNRARTLIVESRATASPKPLEWAHNREYRRLADAAAAGHRRIWNGRACGWGPQQAAHIHVEVHPDAPGVDAQNLNGERVLVENRNKSATLRLGGWWVRDASPYRYVFPRGTSVPAGRTLVLRSGCGNRTALTHYWCSPVPRFLNASFDERALGDGAYLVDRDGDIRRRHLYP